ncbi:MAG: hypothetical protein J6B87_03065 [Clostridia bacterium]|nr:hypothetical protein [Clostridia bacterium]
MSLRSLKRSIAKNVAEKNGLKANRKYAPKSENEKADPSEARSATKIAYEKLYGKGD